MNIEIKAYYCSKSDTIMEIIKTDDFYFNRLEEGLFRVHNIDKLDLLGDIYSSEEAKLTGLYNLIKVSDDGIESFMESGINRYHLKEGIAFIISSPYSYYKTNVVTGITHVEKDRIEFHTLSGSHYLLTKVGSKIE